VLSVSAGSARVRRLANKYTRIETVSGDVAEFEAPDRAIHVSLSAGVEVE
jgi:hypothetical protein